MPKVLLRPTPTTDVRSTPRSARWSQRIARTPVQVVDHAITTSTAAPPARIRHVWLNGAVIAVIRRIFTPLPPPGPHHPRREPYYLEAARMSREMNRL